MSNLRPDFFEWSGKPFRECVTLQHPSSLLGFDPKSYGALLKWGYPKASILIRFSIQNHQFCENSCFNSLGQTIGISWGQAARPCPLLEIRS